MFKTPRWMAAAIMPLLWVGIAAQPALARPAPERFAFTAGVGVAARAGDLFSTLNMKADGRIGDLFFGFQAPVQLRMVDLAPNDGRPGIELRKQDWDERSEWARLLRPLHWTSADRKHAFRIAPLTGATLGHGALVDRYHGALLPDHGKAGLQARTDQGMMGLSVMADDVIAWNIVAGRAHLRPFPDDRGRLRTLEFGFSMGADRRAPRTLSLHTDLTRRGTPTLDSVGLPVASRVPVWLAAFDASIALVQTRSIAVSPYLDVAAVRATPRPGVGQRDGVGVHAGLRMDLAALGATWTFRYEARASQGAWIPGWIDTTYDLERFTLRTRAGLRPKIAARTQQGIGLSHLLEVDARLGSVRVVARTARSSDPNLDATSLWVQVPLAERLQLSAFVSRPRHDGFDELLDPGTLLFAGSARFAVFKPFVAWLDVARAYHALPGARFVPTVDVAVGIAMRRTL